MPKCDFNKVPVKLLHIKPFTIIIKCSILDVAVVLDPLL